MKKNKQYTTTIQIQLPLVAFGEYYKSLNKEQKSLFRRKTIKECVIVPKTFDNWVNANSSPSQAQRLRIMQIHNQNFAFAERNRRKISFKYEATSSTQRHHART